jgi:hypothetical protein
VEKAKFFTYWDSNCDPLVDAQIYEMTGSAAAEKREIVAGYRAYGKLTAGQAYRLVLTPKL